VDRSQEQPESPGCHRTRSVRLPARAKLSPWLNSGVVRKTRSVFRHHERASLSRTTSLRSLLTARSAVRMVRGTCGPSLLTALRSLRRPPSFSQPPGDLRSPEQSAHSADNAPFNPTFRRLGKLCWVGLKGAAFSANPGEASTHWSVVRKTLCVFRHHERAKLSRTTASRGS